MLAKVSDHLLELSSKLPVGKGVNLDNKVIGVVVLVFGDDTSTGLSAITLDTVSHGAELLGEGEHIQCEQDRGGQAESSTGCFSLRSYNVNNSFNRDTEALQYLPTPESPTRPTTLVGGHWKLARVSASPRSRMMVESGSKLAVLVLRTAARFPMRALAFRKACWKAGR